MTARSLLILSLGFLAACSGGDQADTGFAAELDVDTTKMTRSGTGLYSQDVRPGEGAPLAAGQTAVVHYTGWLPDGTKFDSSRDRNQPFPVAVGQGQVIPGWEEGLQGMKRGGVRKLVIPPTLAYGPAGIPGAIPPNATLVFEVELLEVQ